MGFGVIGVGGSNRFGRIHGSGPAIRDTGDSMPWSEYAAEMKRIGITPAGCKKAKASRRRKSARK